MAARELARAGKRVTMLEARNRCGGRIYPLSAEEFGYAAEGGPEFVHGAAPVTRAVMREARLSLVPRGGTRWSTRTGALSPADPAVPHAGRFYQALQEVKADLPIAEFLEMRFAGQQYSELRRSITRTVEGYDAADPHRFSTLALRDEWLGRDDGEHGRVREGYGALVEFLASECRGHGAAIHLGAAVAAIDESGERIAARCRDGAVFEADAVILTVPLPLLSEIALPPAARERVAATADIGFGNVVKILLRFGTKWWADHDGRALADLSFLISDATVPTWWTQHPDEYPVLTGWFAGPKADRVPSLSEAELVDMGVASLAEIFDLPQDRITRDLVAARAINWANDPFARGAYSYATPKTRVAQSALTKPDGGAIFFSGEALYAGPDMGTVEAALANGRETARTILMGSPANPRSRAR
jgi:monoamine oxidase